MLFFCPINIFNRSWWQPDGSDGLPNRCEENHYYLHPSAGIWVANGGPGVDIDSDAGCQGCSHTYDIVEFWYNTSGIEYVDITYPDNSVGGGNNNNADTEEILTAILIVVVIIVVIAGGVILYAKIVGNKNGTEGGGSFTKPTSTIKKVQSTSARPMSLSPQKRPQMVSQNSHSTTPNTNKPPPVPSHIEGKPNRTGGTGYKPKNPTKTNGNGRKKPPPRPKAPPKKG